MPHTPTTTTSTSAPMSGEPPRDAEESGPRAPQRRTRQRAAVDGILREVSEFRSAQEIHDDLRHKGDPIGLTTVYRTLQAMAEAGEVDAIRTAVGETAYRRCSNGHHHHLVCRTCGRTVEVSGPAVERWASLVAAEHGFRDVSHDLEIFGTCADC
jgi:Fur family transcriptional regulator, ferric uptake regulator